MSIFNLGSSFTFKKLNILSEQLMIIFTNLFLIILQTNFFSRIFASFALKNVLIKKATSIFIISYYCIKKSCGSQSVKSILCMQMSLLMNFPSFQIQENCSKEKRFNLNVGEKISFSYFIFYIFALKSFCFDIHFYFIYMCFKRRHTFDHYDTDE